MRFDPADPAGPAFRAAVSAQLAHFLDAQRQSLAIVGDRLDLFWPQAAQIVQGGKRLRPAFCYWSYVATAAEPADPTALLTVAASLDLLHSSALVHDDIIDASDSRRGQPTAHQAFAQSHQDQSWAGSETVFGRNAAIILGDLLLAAAVAMAERSAIGAAALDRARPYLDAARTEVAVGQYLDLRHQAAGPSGSVEETHLIMEFKTSRYTVARPVQIGAALALAPPDQLAVWGDFGSHLGQAYQMRDDLLGMFGDAAQTGKPAGDDLREGKRTRLIAEGLRRAQPAAAKRLAGLFGQPAVTADEIAEAQQILLEAGAVAAIEQAIADEAGQARQRLATLALTPAGDQALENLIAAAIERTH
ncbi:MAG: polyprenyl synthetase family protein [Propionibacteriaceae bacterium]|jgi:geranylgeranyl diphosphate synthase type I|nr:polyprenyl synthetase family protein [Propionibacteriaceae bacterium]